MKEIVAVLSPSRVEDMLALKKRFGGDECVEKVYVVFFLKDVFSFYSLHCFFFLFII